MSTLALVKVQGGILMPTNVESEQVLDTYKLGTVIHADFKKMRNPIFHRKFFALLRVGYDSWEPNQISNKHGAIEKNHQQFREDVTILAGFYQQLYRLDGTFRVVAKSISFAKMDEIEFTALYNAACTVILGKVLKGYTRDDLDRVVDQVLGFC